MLCTLLLVALGVNQANDRCPVTGFPVANHRLYHHVTVRDRQYYVYDRDAANRLRACPDCFLGRDGTPLNALGGKKDD